MIYKVTMTIEGAFPSGRDGDTTIVSAEKYHRIQAILDEEKPADIWKVKA